jgi:hypothetical protein
VNFPVIVPDAGDIVADDIDCGACADNAGRKPADENIKVVYFYRDIFDDFLNNFALRISISSPSVSFQDSSANLCLST